MRFRDEIRGAFIARNKKHFVMRTTSTRLTKRARRLVIRGESPLKGRTHHESHPSRRAGAKRRQQRLPPTRTRLAQVAKVRASWPARPLAVSGAPWGKHVRYANVEIHE